MGTTPSTPLRGGENWQETAEYLVGMFVGDKLFPLSSEFWKKLLEIPFNVVEWPSHRIHEACELLDQTIDNLVIRNVLNFIASVDVSPETYQLLLELLNFMIITMSTQLLCGPSPGPNDDSSLVSSVVHKLLLNYINRPGVPFNGASFYDGNKSSVLKRVGSAAANIVLLPSSHLISSSGKGSRSPIADSSLHVLLVLIHYHKCFVSESYSAASDSLLKEITYFSSNPYCKALEHTTDSECGPHVKLPFALLFDTLGMYLADETAVLLLFSLLHENSAFMEHVLVRTDLDPLLMPILEALYDAPRRTVNKIYMMLIILLILSQDSSFNASIHKLILPTMPWYKERLLHIPYVWRLVLSRWGFEFNAGAINLFPVDLLTERLDKGVLEVHSKMVILTTLSRVNCRRY